MEQKYTATLKMQCARVACPGGEAGGQLNTFTRLMISATASGALRMQLSGRVVAIRLTPWRGGSEGVDGMTVYKRRNDAHVYAHALAPCTIDSICTESASLQPTWESEPNSPTRTPQWKQATLLYSFQGRPRPQPVAPHGSCHTTATQCGFIVIGTESMWGVPVNQQVTGNAYICTRYDMLTIHWKRGRRKNMCLLSRKAVCTSSQPHPIAVHSKVTPTNTNEAAGVNIAEPQPQCHLQTTMLDPYNGSDVPHPPHSPPRLVTHYT